MFIELTILVSWKVDSEGNVCSVEEIKKEFFNMSLFSRFGKKGDYSFIQNSNEGLMVTETPQQIRQKIKEAQNEG